MVKQSVPKVYLTEVNDALATITQANFHVRLFHILKIHSSFSYKIPCLNLISFSV